MFIFIFFLLLCFNSFASKPPHHHGKVVITIDDSPSSKLAKLNEEESKVQPATIRRSAEINDFSNHRQRSPRVVLESPWCNTKVKLAFIAGAVTVISAGLSAAVTLSLRSCN